MRNIVILNSLHFSYPLPILMRVSYNTLIVKQNTSDYYKYIQISRLNAILEKAFNWFPLLKEMLRMEKLCYAIGFTKDMVNSLLTKKEAIRCNGKVYSEEHRRRFEIKNDVFKVEKSSVDDNKLVLTINRQPISEWFKEQWEKLRQGLRQSTEESRKSRGFRM